MTSPTCWLLTKSCVATIVEGTSEYPEGISGVITGVDDGFDVTEGTGVKLAVGYVVGCDCEDFKFSISTC